MEKYYNVFRLNNQTILELTDDPTFLDDENDEGIIEMEREIIENFPEYDIEEMVENTFIVNGCDSSADFSSKMKDRLPEYGHVEWFGTDGEDYFA